MINIDDKVHVIGNHGTIVWADRGVDTCIQWQVNMTCPFNTYIENDKQITFITMPKEVYEDRISFLAHWYLFHILKEPYMACCQLAMADVYGNKVQCETNEIKPNDYKKRYLRHEFDEVKAPNYMYIFKVGAFDRVQTKCKILEFTLTKKKVPTTFTTKYWIWLNVDRDDPRGLSYKSTCPHPFTPLWEYCKKYRLKYLTELKAYQSGLKSAESGELFDVTPISSRTRHVPNNRPQTSQASQRKSHKRGKSADTRQSDAKVKIPKDDASDLAKKVLRTSEAQSDVSVHSTVCPLGGLLNEW